jgi:hypothetical protein
MNKLLSKIIAASALLFSTTAFAQGSCCPEPYAPPCCENTCCGSFFLSAELLYWRAFEGGLANNCEGIVINTFVEDDTTFSLLYGKSHFPSSEWDLGFRVGVGYQFANSSCDLAVYWSRYHTHTSGGNELNEYKWKLDYNVVDVLYRCDFSCSPCFALNPYLGVRYAQIDQNLDKEVVMTIDEVEELSTTRIKEDFWGVGPLFGVEGNLGLGCGLSLYGNVAVGVLYGNYDVDARKVTELETVTNVDHLINDNHATPIVLDLGFGVRWQTCYCNDKLITLQLGLEEHRYFNHNQFCVYGDLSLAGLNFGIGIEF